MNRLLLHIPAALSLLLAAGAVQSLAGGLLQQVVEGWSAGAATSVFQAVVYPAPALIGLWLLVVAARRMGGVRVAEAVATGATAALAAPFVVLCGYAAFGVVGIDTLIFPIWGAALALYAAVRLAAPRMDEPRDVLALAPGWLVAAPVLAVMERKYQLLAAMSDQLFDPNAVLLLVLAALTLAAGPALAPWFVAPRDQSRRAWWRWAVGGALLVGWGALLWANRAVIVPRLYPEVHGALAFFELVLLVGALGWLVHLPRRRPDDDADVIGRLGLLAAAVVVAACAALVLVGSRPDAVVPRRVDYTADFFSKPWQWAFDRDGDGYLSTRLGGVDCSEGEGGINPLSREQPGDGVDQSCTGADLQAGRATRSSGELPHPDAGPGVDLAIVVTIDMLRPDFLQIYGSKDETTPSLSEHAGEFTRFDHAYTSGGITTLALPSLLTGRIPFAIDFEPVHRTVDLRYVFPNERTDDDIVNRTFASPRGDRHPNLAEVFAGAGRSTYAIVDDGPAAIFQEGVGYERGFQTFHYPNAPEGPGEESWGARQVTDAAIEAALNAPPGSLLWLHYYDPHAAGSEYCDRFEPTAGLGCYRDAIRHVDAMLGEFIDRLREGGRWNDSLMIVTSDHGEALGEHGLRHHGLDSYEEFVRIPLLLKTPGDDHPRTSDAPASLIDATTTVVAAAGLSPPATFQGDDLRALARGERRRHPVVSQMLITGVDGRPVRQQTLLVDGQMRYMYDRITQRSWLYDIGADPEQMDPLGGRSQYRSELLELLDHMERRTSHSRALKFP